MKVDGFPSSCLPVLLGVPLKIILVPLLFLIYINDLATRLHHSLAYILADDTELLKSILSHVNRDHITVIGLVW